MKTLMKTSKERWMLSALVASLLFAAMPAHAGPTTVGPITGLVNYFKNNIAVDIETLGIIAVAIIMFSMQIRWQFVLGVCAGIWGLANTDTIRGVFAGG